MSDFNHHKFIESIPSLFSTAMQRATMCSLLWNQQNPKTIIYNLRLYDIVRRLYYVETGEDATDERIVQLMGVVKGEKKIMDFFMIYIESGKFPENSIIKLIHK
jgi:uncharacterized protein YfbU (UPF0304 family)